MNQQQRRMVGYAGVVLVVLGTYTLLYWLGMTYVEGEPRSFLESLNVVVETVTTVGYGEDADAWDAAPMLALMVGMQLSGVLLMFLALPVFVVPWFESRIETNPPTRVRLAEHVVICGYSARGEALVEELEAADVEYVIVEPDRAVARELVEAGHTVIQGDPESTEALSAACVPAAAAVVMDASDETNATIALSVRELAPDVRVVGFVEDPELADYVRYAGADQVLSPRDLLGRSLADKVTSAVTARLGETVEIGDDFEIVELPVQPGSELDGVSLAASGIRERTGAHVVGAWQNGEFVAAPEPERVIDRDTILLVAGREPQLAQLKELTLSDGRDTVREHVVVGGYGEVGSTICETLADGKLRATVVDLEEKPGVDVVGDVTDAETLRTAGIEDASAFILALADDTTTVFATLVARRLAPDVEIICRSNSTESVSKLYSAGADYVLALATVSGRMLAETILGEDVMSLDRQVEIVRTQAPGLAGKTLAGADVRSRTGCTVIAVERDGEVLTDLGPEFRIRDGDSIVVAGLDHDVTSFTDLAGARPTPA